MTGNEHDARAAFNAFKNGTTENLFSRDGSTRMVYLINGVIYKVNLFQDDLENANFDEYVAAKMLVRKLPDNVRIPEMSIFDINGNTVLAMEFVTGNPTGECSDRFFSTGCEDDGLCMPDRLIANLNKLGWTDSTWGNAIHSDGIYFLIDVAC